MGDSALFVLKGIEDMLQTEVKFFSMIRKEGERMYICLGKRALFLIDFEPPFQEQFYYAWVQRVIIDSDNLLLFQIDFSEGRAPLILESFERDRLCDELAICWKADSMFRQWRCAPARAKKTKSRSSLTRLPFSCASAVGCPSRRSAANATWQSAIGPRPSSPPLLIK